MPDVFHLLIKRNAQRMKALQNFIKINSRGPSTQVLKHIQNVLLIYSNLSSSNRLSAMLNKRFLMQVNILGITASFSMLICSGF